MCGAYDAKREERCQRRRKKLVAKTPAVKFIHELSRLHCMRVTSAAADARARARARVRLHSLADTCARVRRRSREPSVLNVEGGRMRRLVE